MKKVKNLSCKLMAVLLSTAMIFSPMLQSMPVYAAEMSIETEDVGTMPEAAESEENEMPEENDSENEASEESASDNKASEESASGSESSEEASSESKSSEETGSDNEASDETGSGNEASDENASENETSEQTTVEETTEEETTTEVTTVEETETETETETEEELDEVALKTAARKASTAKASDFSNVGGWNESIYAEISGIGDTDVTEVSYSGAMSGKLSAEDLAYLVRKSGNGVRIDIPGLKAGTYTLTVKVGQSSTLEKSGITVYAYDRSGFAHFNYSDGVGAYNDDGTLKDNAIILYVTDTNKNDVELKVGNITVKGIGNILNSVGQDAGGGKASNGGKANTNQGIIKELAKSGKPLVVRFIGTVSDSGLYKQGSFSAASECLIEGLTTYNSVDNGGTAGDNGHMARIQSGKDITIEGIGYDAVIDGWGFHYIAQTSDPNLGKSFEVRNLTFINTPEDAIGMEGQQASKNASSDLTASVERCWVHNNEFYCPEIDGPAESDKSEGDGSVDFKRGQYFTCSYNYFDSCHKTNLVGSADYSLQFNLTYHHNYWYMCKARGPLTRRANVHMYNNVWDMQTDYAQNTRADAYIFSEYNMFYACKSPQAVEAGAIKSFNDSIASVIWNKGSAGTVVDNKSDYVSNACQFQARNIKYDKFDTDSSQSYIPGNNYELQTDFADLRKVIVSQTGVQKQNPERPDAITANRYSVVERAAGSNINKFGSLPQTLTPGKISKSVYAFEVGAAFDLEIEYSGAVGVLVNETGENLLTGNGNAIDLPAGKYMIQAENFQPGNPAKNTIAVFKDITISSLKISQHDPNAHYHKYKLDPSKSISATCTEAGKNVYTCEGTGDCTEKTKEETVAALGHSYGAWQVITEATETEDGLKRRTCTRCNDAYEEAVIPKGTTGTGDDNTGGGSTAAGDYELYFTGKKTNGDTDFFTVSGNYAEKKGPVTVNGISYTDCLKIESKTTLSFSCNDGATLFMAFDGANKKIKIDGTEYTTDSNGTLTIENLSSGTHSISKGDSMNLFYISVANAKSNETYYTLYFDYNYDDAPDPAELEAIDGRIYASESDLAPASFTRKDYVLNGLYTDASCTNAVTYPYTVKGNATFYADWKESDDPVETSYSLIFNSNGGSAVATVRVAASQLYEIKQKTTKSGYVFAGWYDALEGGNLVSLIDGSKLTGNITVYAHWLELPPATSYVLDCAADLTKGTNITKTTTINGFTIHALEGGVGEAGKENPKYYMSVTSDGKLGTNGVLLTDKTIPGNEDGLLKSIEFEAKNKGMLSVDVELSGNGTAGKQYDIVLAKKTSDNSLAEVNRKAISSVTKPAKETMDFAIEEAGTYYIYPEGDKGVRYSKLTFTEESKEVYTILYHAGLGTAPDGVEAVAKAAGETVELPGACTPAAGYQFKGWSVDGTNVLTGTYTVNEEDAVDGIITITALYDSLSYTIKYDAGDGTLPEGIQNNASVQAGQIIDLAKFGDCTPPAGYVFKGWKVGSRTVKSSYTVNGTDADDNKVITLTAVYEPEEVQPIFYTVKYDAGDGTLPEGVEAAATAVEGTPLTLPEACTPPADKNFIGWLIGASTELSPAGSSYIVSAADADADNTITIKAAYESKENPVKRYTVTLDLDGGTLVNGGATELLIVENETITDPGSCEKEGYDFKEWTVDGAAVKFPYTITKDVTLKATYTKKDTSSENPPVGPNDPKHNGIVIVGLEKSYDYTGTKVIPNIGVMDYDIAGGKLLAPGVDYTVKYKDNTKPTEESGKPATVTVTGKGNYKGKNAVKEFQIVKVNKTFENPLNLKGAKIEKISPEDYTGKAHYPAFSLKLKGESSGTLYTYNEAEKQYETSDGTSIQANVAISNNINAGTAAILITGAEERNKPTQVKATFKITPINLSQSDVTVTAEAGTYAVKGAAPASITVKVKLEDGTQKTLRNGTDYTVKYSNNKKAVENGAKITISGKGNYSKKYTDTYTIKQLNMKEIEVKAVTAYAGIKAGKIKATVVDKNGDALKPAQYTLNIYSGENTTPCDPSEVLDENSAIRVEAAAKDEVNLTGKTTAEEFTVGTNIAKAKIVLNKDPETNKTITKAYTGSDVELDGDDLTVTIKGVDDPLTLGVDYEIAAYTNNIDKGTATAIIKGIGSYSGTKTVKFKIVEKPMEFNEKESDVSWDELSTIFKALADILN